MAHTCSEAGRQGYALTNRFCLAFHSLESTAFCTRMHHNDALTADVGREGKSQNLTRKTDVGGTRHLSASGRSRNRGNRGGRGRGGLGVAGGFCRGRGRFGDGVLLTRRRERRRRRERIRVWLTIAPLEAHRGSSRAF